MIVCIPHFTSTLTDVILGIPHKSLRKFILSAVGSLGSSPGGRKCPPAGQGTMVIIITDGGGGGERGGTCRP